MKGLRNFWVFAVVFLVTVGILNFVEHTQQSRPDSVQHDIHLQTTSEASGQLVLGRAGGPRKPAKQQHRADLEDERYPFRPIEDVKISVQTGHFFGGDFEGLEPNCTIGKTVINCRYGSSVDPHTADALWYHIPSMGGASSVQKYHPKQLTIAMSMESSEYYPALDNKDFMRVFDIETTYRSCSQVPIFYFDYNPNQLSKIMKPAKPFEEKKTALVYVNSNCGAKSGRSDIMRQVLGLNHPTIPTHSYGNCDRNMEVNGHFDKVELISGYKFCVAMENSITKDYITEKLWQALEAGCVPVYMGPHNIAEFLPDPEAIIDYNKLGSPEALMKELERLASDKAAYEAKLSWKSRRLEQQSADFQAKVVGSAERQPHTRCQLCRVVLKNRYRPQNFTTCLWNETWTRDYHVKA
ncbi:hypothetical protein Agub_g13508 [Astrephomene gubernaculifera]|uniref:Fucosyltransferase n=1 Tax=Astrephomene gubernaculifera TaxID=47775 RepID=A0AAD3HS54_9CHLO|nr:hypothetical protein Agub_g13508 [Astrephomene gubernaculifera]